MAASGSFLRMAGRADGALNMAFGAGLIVMGLKAFGPALIKGAQEIGGDALAEAEAVDAHLRGKGVLLAMVGFLSLRAPNPEAQRLAALTMAVGDASVLVECAWARRNGSQHKISSWPIAVFCCAEATLLLSVARACGKQ